jgi:hypothetical protein
MTFKNTPKEATFCNTFILPLKCQGTNSNFENKLVKIGQLYSTNVTLTISSDCPFTMCKTQVKNMLLLKKLGLQSIPLEQIYNRIVKPTFLLYVTADSYGSTVLDGEKYWIGG